MKNFMLLFVFCVPLLGYATETPWQGKKAAVVLTYDDALNVHIDKVVPALKKNKLTATFYVSVGFPEFITRMEDWRKVGKAGFELGNHSMFHPCEGQRPGREWVSAERDLSSWSRQRMVNDIIVTNAFLKALDQQDERTFAYPCGDMKASGESYVSDLQTLFVAERGVQSGLQAINEVDLSNIYAYMVNGDSAEKMNKMVDEAIAQKKLLVFMFHGVGGEHGLNVDEKEHALLLEYINKQSKNLWVASMLDVAKFIRSEQQVKQ